MRYESPVSCMDRPPARRARRSCAWRTCGAAAAFVGLALVVGLLIARIWRRADPPAAAYPAAEPAEMAAAALLRLSAGEQARIEHLLEAALERMPDDERERIFDLWTQPEEDLTWMEQWKRIQAARLVIAQMTPSESEEMRSLVGRLLWGAPAGAADADAGPPPGIRSGASDVLWEHVHDSMTDPDLTDDQRRRLWEKQFAGRRIIWSGAVRRLVPEDRRIEFVMSPSLGSGVDVSVAVRTDRGTRNNRIRPGRYFAFSGTLDDYPIPGLEHPVFVRDGEVFTN